MPNNLMPPKTPTNIIIGFIFDLSDNIFVLIIVSIKLNNIPKTKMLIATVTSPSTYFKIANGTHTIVGPNKGIKAKTPTTIPQIIGALIPNI